MNFDREIKKCLLEKDICNLKAAEFEQRKFALEAKRRVAEAETRLSEYSAQIKTKQAELEMLELAELGE
jgi:hypothetical protein